MTLQRMWFPGSMSILFWSNWLSRPLLLLVSFPLHRSYHAVGRKNTASTSLRLVGGHVSASVRRQPPRTPPASVGEAPPAMTARHRGLARAGRHVTVRPSASGTCKPPGIPGYRGLFPPGGGKRTARVQATPQPALTDRMLAGGSAPSPLIGPLRLVACFGSRDTNTVSGSVDPPAPTPPEYSGHGVDIGARGARVAGVPAALPPPVP